MVGLVGTQWNSIKKELIEWYQVLQGSLGLDTAPFALN